MNEKDLASFKKQISNTIDEFWPMAADYENLLKAEISELESLIDAGEKSGPFEDYVEEGDRLSALHIQKQMLHQSQESLKDLQLKIALGI